jgi:DNA helicase-2/ATP-dependent DNA helicase PcrA
MARGLPQSMLDELNPPQREAVITLGGPLLVLAGAGTGKTRVVTYRIANLIRHGTQPDRILAVTFTNKAAREMKDRVGKLVKPGKAKPHPKRRDDDEAMPIVATFHAYCVRILRRYIAKLGYPEQFAIYDRGEQESVARAVLRELRVGDAALKPGDLLWAISTWKNSCIRPPQAESIAQTDKEHLAAAGYRRYQRALKNAGVVDFDDILLLTEELFSKHAEARKAEASLLDHLLIDEYQDTNGSQYRIVKALAGGHRNLCVVGDDDQSIYGWRGAEVEHILHFNRDWPEAKVVRLEDNYRSQAEIINVANRLIAYNTTRHDKVLRPAREHGPRPQIWQAPDEENEAKMVVEDIQRQLAQGREPREFAILFRTNEQPRPFETELRKAKLPYLLVGGMSFFDRREVRDIIAYLKLLDSPDDEVSLRRIINTPPRGIGPSTVEKLTERAVEAGVPLWKLLANRHQQLGLSHAATEAIAKFVGEMSSLHEMMQAASAKGHARGALAEAARRMVERIDYKAELARLYDEENDREARWAAVEQVINAFAQYEQGTRKASLKGFIDEITLAGRDMEPDDKQTQNKITLMTLHAAKGLEFPDVYMVGMEEGLLPHHRSVAVEGKAIEEERRLCYVGLTRAQDRLTLLLALSRMKWGKPRDTDPSRFLFEITGQTDKANDRPPKPKARHKSSGRVAGKRGK